MEKRREFKWPTFSILGWPSSKIPLFTDLQYMKCKQVEKYMCDTSISVATASCLIFYCQRWCLESFMDISEHCAEIAYHVVGLGIRSHYAYDRDIEHSVVFSFTCLHQGNLHCASEYIHQLFSLQV